MTPEQHEMIKTTLRPYGASLTPSDAITSDAVGNCGIRAVVKGRRLRFESIDPGCPYSSGPVNSATVEHFVEGFWYWSKK